MEEYAYVLDYLPQGRPDDRSYRSSPVVLAIGETEFKLLEDIVSKQEGRFIEFFNKAEPINARLHSLELLPGLGNKTMWAILEERKKKPFTSFADLTERVKSIHNPQKMIVNRIIDELKDRFEKYKLFVAK